MGVTHCAVESAGIRLSVRDSGFHSVAPPMRNVDAAGSGRRSTAETSAAAPSTPPIQRHRELSRCTPKATAAAYEATISAQIPTTPQ